VVICLDRCRLFTYGPADATALPKPPSSLASFKYRLVPAFYPGYPGKEAIKRV